MKDIAGLQTHFFSDLLFYLSRSISADKIETVLLNNKNLNKYILNLDNLHAIDILDRVEVVGDIIARDLINLTQLNEVHFDLIAEKVRNSFMITTNNTHFVFSVVSWRSYHDWNGQIPE